MTCDAHAGPGGSTLSHVVLCAPGAACFAFDLVAGGEAVARPLAAVLEHEQTVKVGRQEGGMGGYGAVNCRMLCSLGDVRSGTHHVRSPTLLKCPGEGRTPSEFSWGALVPSPPCRWCTMAGAAVLPCLKHTPCAAPRCGTPRWAAALHWREAMMCKG